MKLQEIRNATIKVQYGGKIFLIDPWFERKGEGSIAPAFDRKKRVPSPTVELPFKVEEIMKDVDAVIVTHIHMDHFEANTAKMIDKNIPVYTLNEETAIKIRAFGYKKVTVLLDTGNEFEGVTITRTEGMHGRTKILSAGKVCGVVFTAKNEETLYVAGDTVYYKGVERTINKYKPKVIVVNACGASLMLLGRLIMDEKDVEKVCLKAPKAIVIASHMEAVNHATLTRDELRNYADTKGFISQLEIPADGEILIF